MGKTLAKCHEEVVEELINRGEIIFNPTTKTMLDVSQQRPKVYVKNRIFPSKEFICGIGIKEKNGTISILEDAMADLQGIGGFKIEELGLCDPVLHYANNDRKTYPLKEEYKNLKLLQPQNSFPKESWIEYSSELEKEIKTLKSHLLIKTCEKIYWSLYGSKRPEEKSTPIQYSNEANEELKRELPNIFKED